jgi:hypothetical protein
LIGRYWNDRSIRRLPMMTPRRWWPPDRPLLRLKQFALRHRY